MSSPEIVVQGRVTADGRLELDTQPGVPAGPVEVVIRSLAASHGVEEDWWQYLQRARAELEAAGHRFRTKQEIDADIEELRSGDDRIDEERCQVHQKRRE